MKPRFIYATVLSSFLLLPVFPLINATTPVRATEEIRGKLSAEQLQQLALSVTVKVSVKENEGSGTLIGKEGKIYTVVTNAHVISLGEPYLIQTPDGKTHIAQLNRKLDFPNQDIALLQFEAEEIYTVAEIANEYQYSQGEAVSAAGFVYDRDRLVVVEGNISLLLKKKMAGGYAIGYSNEIVQGMSGGPILNNKGELIGINGLRAYPIVENYRFEDGTEVSAEQKEQFRRNSWGIPINLIAAKIKAYEAYQRGWQHFLDKDHEEAIEAFDEAIRLAPDYAEAYYGRGLAKSDNAWMYGGSYTYNRRKEEIKKDFVQALTLFRAQQKEGDVYRIQGEIYELEEEWEKALQAYDQAIGVNLDDAIAYLGRSGAYRELKKYDRALTEINKVIELKPDYLDSVYNFQGLIYTYQNKPDLAIEAFSKAIELNPNNAIAYLNRAQTRAMTKGDFQGAIADLNQFIKLKPNVPLLYLERAALIFQKGEFESSLTDLNKALEIDNRYAPAYFYRGIVYTSLKNYQQAIADLTKAIEFNIEDQSERVLAQTYFLRGKSYYDLKQYIPAVADAKKAIQLLEEMGDQAYLEQMRQHVLTVSQQLLKAAEDALSQGEIAEGKTRNLLEAKNQVDVIAQKITVKVDSATKQGSGVIIARQGDTYTVLTVGHAVDRNNNPEIVTPDGKRHPGSVTKNLMKEKNVDLALIEFTSSETYQLATLGNYQNPEEEYWVFVYGFTGNTSQPQLSTGQSFF